MPERGAAAALRKMTQDPLLDGVDAAHGRSSHATPTAELRAVSKSFGGTVAVQDVALTLYAGQVLALLGENGAGKSTCVKLLAGVIQPDVGHVVVDGHEVEFGAPQDAQRHGIAVMHQHPGLFPDLSVLENLFIGHARIGRFGMLDRASMREQARALLETVGLECPLEMPLQRLRSSEQQLVEIARALSIRARVLIMDEPTAALSQREVDRLFEVVDGLRGQGVTMMFVGHRMEEIYRIADRISVLRDGHLIATTTVKEMPRSRAISLMVGRSLGDLYPERRAVPGETVLEVRNLGRGSAFAGVSFAVRSGEILGFAGLVGSGRTEIARVLFGVDQATSGMVLLDGREVRFATPGDAMASGIAYVSEDRIGQSLVMDFGILPNASLPVIDRATTLGLVSPKRELGLVRGFLEQLRLRFSSYWQPVRTLSGGNQQKVVLSKWLATGPRVLILDEPTQGIDVQTKAEVHALIADLAAGGMAIVLISSELPELIGMCDRLVVLREGRMTAAVDRDVADQEGVLHAMTDASGSARSSGQHGADLQEHRGTGWLRRLLAHREVGLVLAMLAVIVPVAAINPRMLSGSNLTALAMDAALLTIVAAGQMLVILTRSIDLSVASVIGLSAYVAADVLHSHPEFGVVGGIAVACGVGVLCGLANGLVVTAGRVPGIVVTLGTLTLYRGIDSLYAGGKQVNADQVPQAWLDLTGGSIADVPSVVVIAFVTLAAIAFALRSFPFGRELYAIGSNPDGAALIGIPVGRRVLATFACAGLLAGFDGALWASRYATIDSRVAIGFELTVIAAVVVGGVAIRGGAGTILGMTLGALTLLVIRNGLTLVRVDPLWLQGVYGLVILIAIAIDAFVIKRGQRAR